MLIHNSLAAAEENRHLSTSARSAAASKSPGRLIAEGLWFTIWHAAKGVLAAWSWSVFAERIRRERHTLSTLDDAQLRDIGLSRAQADTEAARHWIDLPPAR